MTTKFREGSAGAAEAKELRILSIFFFIVSIGVFLAWHVFDTNQHTVVKTAPGFCRVLGAISILGSAGWLYYGGTKDWPGIRSTVLFFLTMIFGIICSLGFNLS